MFVSSSLHQALVRVGECTPAAVQSLIRALEAGRIGITSTPSSVASVLYPESIPPHILSDLLRAWRDNPEPGPDTQSMVLALGVSLTARQRATSASPGLDLVWTGPYPPAGISAQPTLTVMQEMLGAARRRVLLVGYSLSIIGESPRRIIAQLVKARRRGCAVTVALNSDRFNHAALAELWPERVPPPRLLTWRGRPGDQIASLHAKVLAVDDTDLLITSANLTYHGLESNIELGVRIRSGLAARVTGHFESLAQQGILVEARPS